MSTRPTTRLGDSDRLSLMSILVVQAEAEVARTIIGDEVVYENR